MMCEPLARLIWDKLRQSLKRDDVFEIMPYGYANERMKVIGIVLGIVIGIGIVVASLSIRFGSAGVWAPVGINPCMRFTRYSIGLAE